MDHGLASLKAKPPTGRAPKLTPVQLDQVKLYIVGNVIKSEGGRLQGKDIQIFIES